MHVAIIPPTCDDNDCTTEDTYSTATCECVYTPIAPPSCDDGLCSTEDSYDVANCECVHVPVEPLVCDDNDCNTADVYNPETCACEYNPITPTACDDMDCTTADAYDTATCSCVYTPIAPPTCDDMDCLTEDTFNPTTCECVYTPIDVPTCDDMDCTTLDTYDTATCECVYTAVVPPTCDDNDCSTVDSYNPTVCTCVYTPIVVDCNDNDCTTFDYYDANLCSCVNDPEMEPVCDDGLCTTEDTYNAATCECEYTPIAPPSCNDNDACTFDYYDTATCACVNEADCTNDPIPPVITIIDNEIIGMADGDTLFVECDNMPFLNANSVVVTDCCDDNPMVEFIDSVSAGVDCTIFGYKQVFVCGWKATDAAGNMSTYFVNIAVIDNTPPTISFNENLATAFSVPSIMAGDTIEADCTNLPVIPDSLAADYVDVFDQCGGTTITQSDDYMGTGDCPDEHIYRCTWTATDRCGNASTITFYVNSVCDPGCGEDPDLGSRMELGLRVYLQGGLIGVDNSGAMNNFLMKDDIRVQNMLPPSEPYTGLNFTHMGNGGGEVADAGVFNVAGSDAVIDWILVELRDANDPSIILSTRSGLVQRDGEVVDMDGVSPLGFEALTEGDYYIAVRHRNHLGAMSSAAVTLSENAMALVDFTTGDTWGSHAQKDLNNGSFALWAGSPDNAGQVIFQGPTNTPNTVFFELLFDPANTTSQPTHIMNGYYSTDFDMQCDVIYQGPNPEPNIPFFNVLQHPENTNFLPNHIMYEQLP